MNDDSKDLCVLSLQKFPRELKKKLKMKALEKDIELQVLCARYLEAGLAKEDSKSSTGSGKRN
jgi:hypothetical protein